MNIPSIYPWDIRAWKVALRQSGISGVAMMTLLLADFVQIPEAPGVLAVHASKATLWLVRGPLVMGAALLICVLPRFSKIGVKDLRFWYLLYTLYFVASTVWSISPVATLGKSFELLICLLIVMQATRDEKAEERLIGMYRLILLLISTMVTITVIGFLLRIDAFISVHQPSLFMSCSAESPFLSANGVGYAASGLILVCFAEWQFPTIHSRSFKWQTAFASVLFLFAGSRTSFGIILIGFLIVLLRKSKAALLAVTLSFAMVWVFLDKLLIKAFSYNQSAGNLQTLSGRTVMWAYGYKEWLRSPLIGYGGGEGGKYVLSRIGISSLEQMSSMHSGIMETLDGLGIIGLLLGIGIFIVVTYWAYRAGRSGTQHISFYVLVIHFWITSLMSLGVLGWMNFEAALYLVFIALMDVKRREKQVARISGSILNLRSPQLKFARNAILVIAACLFILNPVYCQRLPIHLSAANRGVVPSSLFSLNILGISERTGWPSMPFASWRSFHFDWQDVEPSRDQWDFARPDRDMQQALKRGVPVLAVIEGIPNWAASPEQSAGPVKQIGKPASIDDWKNYVRTVALRYKGQIHYYELWNEPMSVETFNKTPAALTTLNQAAYETLKSVDPTIVVVSSALSSGDPKPERANRQLEMFTTAGMMKNCDVVAYHFYVVPFDGTTTPRTPEELLPYIVAVQSTMKKAGINKPLWSTEAGWAVLNSDENPQAAPWYLGKSIDPELGGAYLARTYILGWAAGLDRIYWYCWRHGYMGMTEFNGTSKAPAVAFTTIQRWLVGAKLNSCDRNTAGNWSCKLDIPGNKSGVISWTEAKSAKINIDSAWKARSYWTIDGREHSLGNKTSLHISESPILVVSSR